MFRILVMNGLLISLILIWTSAAKEPSTETLIKSSPELPRGPLDYSLNVEKETNVDIRGTKNLCKLDHGGVCVKKKKSCPSHLPFEKSPGKPYCSKRHRCCYPDPTPAAPTTPAPTTPISEYVSWTDIRNACIKGNNFAVYEPVETINICKEKCVVEVGITCQSIEYSTVEQICSISDTRSDSDDYAEPCFVNGWAYAEIEFNTGPTTAVNTTMVPNNTTTKGPTKDVPTTLAPTTPMSEGVSCNLVWNHEEDRPLIMLRETRVIIPLVSSDISDDPNRIPEAIKLVFACPGEGNVFQHIDGIHSKLHGSCVSHNRFQVCVNNYAEVMELGELSCSNQMHPSIIKQENDTTYKKICEDIGGDIYKMGYIYGDYREFKDLDTKICFRENDQKTLWTSTNVNRMKISLGIDEMTEHGFTMKNFLRQKSQQKTSKELLDKEVTPVWNDSACRDHGGHCVRGGNSCPEHLPYQTSQGEPHCTMFYRCCYSEPCNPTTCTYKGQPGNCGLDSLPITTGVGRQECKKGCQCYIEDTKILRQFKIVQEQRELSKLMGRMPPKACYTGGTGTGGGPCPDDGQFPANYVCTDCKSDRDANKFMNLGVAKPNDNPYILLAGKTSGGTDISYTDIPGSDKCQIAEAVQIWSCEWKKTTGAANSPSAWSCTTNELCNVEIEKMSGIYKPAGNSLKNVCDNDHFINNRVCKIQPQGTKICSNEAQAKKFVESLSFPSPADVSNYPVFGKDVFEESIRYIIKDTTKCKFKNPVKTWICNRVSEVWTCNLVVKLCTVDIEKSTGTINFDEARDCPCPVADIIEKYVPKLGLEFSTEALQFVKKKVPSPTTSTPPYPVFNIKTFDLSTISFEKNIADANKCIIAITVNIWICKPINGKWEETTNAQGNLEKVCILQGDCTAKTSSTTGEFIQGSVQCDCLNPNFLEKHVCIDCQNGEQALKYTKDNRSPASTDTNTVFAGTPVLQYQRIDITSERSVCRITSPNNVKAWKITQDYQNEWARTETLGDCINVESYLDNGHLKFTKTKCYKDFNEHDGEMWQDSDCTTIHSSTSISDPKTPVTCKIKCTEDTRCNAFNYRGGIKCALKECPIPFPALITSTNGNTAYSLNPEYRVRLQYFWNNCDSLEVIKLNIFDTPMHCAKKCTANGACNAFNYKVGVACGLKKCHYPYPATIPSTAGYDAYYSF